MAKETQEFYDVKTKEKFKTDDYRIEERKGRFFAVAKSPAAGATHECWRVVGKDFAVKNK